MTIKLDNGLRPCIQCGGEDVDGDNETGVTPMVSAPLWGIVCSYCGHTVRGNTVAEVRYLWNARIGV